MRKPSKLLTLFAALVCVLFSLSAGIAVPILWRGWYYGQIEALKMSQNTGFSTETIRFAFDEVMDFLVKDAPFGTGSLKWSESGMAHFADCKALFRLDFVILTISALLLLALFAAALISPHFREKMGKNPPVWGLLFTLIVLLIFGSWALVDFDGLFAAFHALCFPGKTNWVFDWQTDEIILILPERFWANTAALAGTLTLALETLLALLWRFLPKTAKTASL